jgi:hypothetical protein
MLNSAPRILQRPDHLIEGIRVTQEPSLKLFVNGNRDYLTIVDLGCFQIPSEVCKLWPAIGGLPGVAPCREYIPHDEDRDTTIVEESFSNAGSLRDHVRAIATGDYVWNSGWANQFDEMRKNLSFGATSLALADDANLHCDPPVLRLNVSLETAHHVQLPGCKVFRPLSDFFNTDGAAKRHPAFVSSSHHN